MGAPALAAMRSDPGPGGTLEFELDGVGVTWFLRRTAEGIRVAEHGGEWPGQNSGCLCVPERDFAWTVLTNSVSPTLRDELAFDDWALQRISCVAPTAVSPGSVPMAGSTRGVIDVPASTSKSAYPRTCKPSRRSSACRRGIRYGLAVARPRSAG